MFKYFKTRNVKSPQKGTALSAGIDFFVPFDFRKTILGPGDDVLIPSGIVVSFDTDCMLIGVDKSGISSSETAKVRAGVPLPKTSSQDTAVMVGAKLIDADYPGEVHIHIINVGNAPFMVSPGMKIAQFVLVPVRYNIPEEVQSRDDLLRVTTERVGGFGSTNI